MNFYEHHLGDWAKKCSHLNATEEGIYRRLLDWYYAHERPLPLAQRDICRLARAGTPNERKAVSRILSEYFELLDDGWHNARADRELERFEKRVPSTLEFKRNLRDRQARSRKRRQSMFDLLRELGETPAFNTTNYELMDMLRARGVKVPAFGEVSRVMSPLRDGDADVQATRIHTPVASNHISASSALTVTEPVTEGAGPTPEALGEAARAVRKAGFASVNSQDPGFVALVQDGVTPQELGLIAHEAIAKEKPLAWVIATAKGRRADAAKAQQAPETYRQRANAAAVAAWTPELARKLP